MPNPDTAALVAMLQSLDADDQQELVETGEQFGTEDVLRQLERFEEADKQTGAIPTVYGFTATDKSQLGQVAAAIRDASGVRVDQRVARSTSTDDYRDAITTGKAAATLARTVLTNTVAALKLVSGAESKATRSIIGAALPKLGKIGRSKIKLQEQLGLLKSTLSDVKVLSATTDRGGQEALAAVTAAIETVAIRTTPGAKPPGTPAETRRLNLLEGLAVSLLRRARAAARAWSSATKDPTLGKAYELEFLYAGSAAAVIAPPQPSNP